MGMRKKVITSIKNDEKIIEYESNVIINDNTFLYREDNYNVKLEYLNDKVVFTRTNDDMRSKFIFDLNDSKLEILLLKNNMNFSMPIKTTKIKKSDNEIIIEYIVEDNVFTYKMFIKEEV